MSHDINEYRKGILLACAGALLHNLGKVSSRFVEAKVPPEVKKEYKYQHICGLFVEDVDSQGKVTQLPSVTAGRKKNFWVDLYDRLKNSTDNKDTLSTETLKALKTEIDSLPSPFDDRSFTYRIGDLIEYLGQGEGLYPKAFNDIFATSSFLTHLMFRAHHGASGGEKAGILELQQRFPIYLATPLGYEKPAPDLLEYERIKEKVEGIIQECLAIPESFSLKEFAGKLEPLLRRIPADTRRGINDVTVWDIGHTGMAFLKAGIWSLAGENPNSYQHKYLDKWQSEKHPRWRLWRVGLEGLDFLCNAVSVADLRVRQRKWREYLDKVRDFAEEKYPVATEVYRDENGSIYIFPDWDKDSVDYIEFKEKGVHIFKDGSVEKPNPAEKDEKEEPSTGHELSLPKVFGLRPATELTEEKYYNNPECKVNSTPYIGEKIEEWIGEPLVGQPDFQVYSEVFKEKSERSRDNKLDDLCPYCGVRVVGGGENMLPAEAKGYNADKAKERKICCVCMYERGQIARDWWTEKPFSTVWVDEAADANGRVALVVGRLAVEKILRDLLIYPPEHLYLAEAQVIRGTLPPAGTEFFYHNIGFKVLDVGTGEIVITDKVERFRNTVQLISLDFSDTSKWTHLGEKRLDNPIDLSIKNTTYSGAGYELNCKNSSDIQQKCQELTGSNKWRDFQRLTCVLKIENITLRATIEQNWQKLKIDSSDSSTIEKQLLWTDGNCYFYLKNTKEVNTIREFLSNWENWKNKKTRLYATPSDSFARFRRVWETTAQFWRDVAPPEEAFSRDNEWQNALLNSWAAKTAGVDGARRRLLLTFKSSGQLDVGPYHAYELAVNGVKMGVLCTNPEKREFVTIENLKYIARQMGASPKRVCDPSAAAAYVLTKLMGKKVQLEESLGYGQGGRLVIEKNNEVEIEEVSFAPDSYCPVIPILAEPRVFAALVPAQMAFALVKNIKEKYEKEMGKVRWRLPLALGLVFIEKNTPLRVVLDAGWRMLKGLEAAPPLLGKVTDKNCLGHSYLEEVKQNNEEINLINHPEKSSWPAAVDITVKVENPVSQGSKTSSAVDSGGWAGKELDWRVVTTAGDGRTFDIWYPWVKVEGIIADRALALQDPDPSSSKHTTWLHVMELEKDDKINFFPSTFDFLFLDHAGRRFELAYDEEGRRRGLARRPYFLEAVDELAELWDLLGGKKGPGEAQIHALWEVLIGKWQDWRPDETCPGAGMVMGEDIWEKFCGDVLLNIKWPKGEQPSVEKMAKLKAEAKDGTLFDVFELFLAILKDRPRGGKE
jgi:hypothetical protein